MRTTESSETCDAILGGLVRVYQPREGYRFSLDSVLLARFALVRSRDRVLELGAGCGVISLAIARLHRPREIVALEIQPELVAMIGRNLQLNALDSVDAIEADLRIANDARLLHESFDVVVANPPYRATGAGRVSPQRGRRLARSEAFATLADFVAASARYTRRGGSAALVFAADRTAELVAMLREQRLEPKRIRFVHPYRDAPATTVLVEARKHGGVELAVEPPLILYHAPRVYSPEARELLGEVASHRAAE